MEQNDFYNKLFFCYGAMFVGALIVVAIVCIHDFITYYV